jgi:hypothetical protein
MCLLSLWKILFYIFFYWSSIRKILSRPVWRRCATPDGPPTRLLEHPRAPLSFPPPPASLGKAPVARRRRISSASIWHGCGAPPGYIDGRCCNWRRPVRSASRRRSGGAAAVVGVGPACRVLLTPMSTSTSSAVRGLPGQTCGMRSPRVPALGMVVAAPSFAGGCRPGWMCWTLGPTSGNGGEFEGAAAGESRAFGGRWRRLGVVTLLEASS